MVNCFFAGKSPTADEFSSRYIGIGLHFLSFYPGSQLWPQLSSLWAIWVSSGQLWCLLAPSWPCLKGPHGTGDLEPHVPLNHFSRPEPVAGCELGKHGIFWLREHRGTPSPHSLPLGLQRFLMDEV